MRPDVGVAAFLIDARFVLKPIRRIESQARAVGTPPRVSASKNWNYARDTRFCECEMRLL